MEDAVQEQLEEAVDCSAALLEALTELHAKGIHGMELSATTLLGLRLIRSKQGEELRNAFRKFVAVTRGHRPG